MSDEKKKAKPPVPVDPRVSMDEAVENAEKLSKAIKMAHDKPQVTARIKKEPFLSKLKNTLLGEDANSVGHYVLWDVLIPAAKDTIQDMVTKGIEMMLFGGQSTGRTGNRSRSRFNTGSTVSYGNYYRSKRPTAREEYVRSPGIGPKIDKVMFDYEEEAGEVLEYMIEVLDQYGVVTVADFYEIANLPTHSSYTDNSLGWRDLSRVKIARTRDGYQLVLPQPIRL